MLAVLCACRESLRGVAGVSVGSPDLDKIISIERSLRQAGARAGKLSGIELICADAITCHTAERAKLQYNTIRYNSTGNSLH
jgi:hypothetical protein